jgi:hypothetical protein
MRTAAVLLMGAVSTAAWAQGVNLTLYHADIDALPAPARVAYQEAVNCNNHADQVGAVENMLVAAKAAPNVVELQWLLCETAEAYVRGDNFGLDRALEIADEVVAAYQRILSNESLPVWARPTVERYYMRLEDLLSNIDERIRSRREASDEYINRTARLHQQVDEARERYAASRRAERAEQARNPESQRVNAPDAVAANPLLLPSRHYDHARIGGRSDVVNPTSNLVLPSRYNR